MNELSLNDGAALRTLLLSDLVGSTRLVEQIGDRRAAELFARHDRLARDLLAEHGGREIDKTDGFLLLFERPFEAVTYALAYHRALDELSEEESLELSARVGIHLGEVFLRENPLDDVARGAKPIEVEGLAKPTAARLMSLAQGRQTLLTRGAFDVARRASVGAESLGEGLEWLAHGGYRIKGVEEPTEIFEVGLWGQAPLEPPPDSEKVKRADRGDAILGWRPAAGQEIARRPSWVLDQKVGEGGFGEVWLARHQKTGDRRVFKFCFDEERLRALQREITVFRLLKEELGERDDIARILEWNFEQAPYFIESEYTAGGSLIDWAEGQGGLDKVPLPLRLEILSQVAEALAAAHSVGILHRDMKPGNVLIHTDARGAIQARVCDFGMGVLTEQERLESAGITALGMTRAMPHTELATTSGTLLYTAPELTEGKAATIQADIYALGLMLYQLVVGNLFRAMGAGWERGVEDELLREDIASAVDVDPKRRPASALGLAERLRSLEDRRARREADRQTKEEKERAVAALARTRKRQGIAAVLFLALAIFAVSMVIQSRRIAREAERANDEAARANNEAESAREVSDFLVEIFQVSTPGEGETITARELLERGADRIAELEDQPIVQARLMHTMGEVYTTLGLYERARALLERALERREDLLGEDHLEVAETLRALGALEWRLDDLGDAEKLVSRALAIKERSSDSTDLAVDGTAALLGIIYSDQGRLDEAEPLLAQDVASAEKTYGQDHWRVANALVNLGSLYQQQGKLEEADILYRRTLEIRERTLGLEHPAVANSLANLASLEMERKRYAEAEPLYLRTLAIHESMGEDYPRVARSLAQLAGLYRLTDRPAEAEPHYLRAIEIRVKRFGEKHAMVASVLEDYAILLEEEGRTTEAAEIRERVARIQEAL